MSRWNHYSPGSSRHSFGASIEVELTDLAQFEAESARLYELAFDKRFAGRLQTLAK